MLVAGLEEILFVWLRTALVRKLSPLMFGRLSGQVVGIKLPAIWEVGPLDGDRVRYTQDNFLDRDFGVVSDFHFHDKRVIHQVNIYTFGGMLSQF